MRRTLSRMHHAKTNHAMLLWKSFNAVKRKMKRDLLLLQRFVARMEAHAALKTIHSWVDFVDWRKGARELMTRSLKRMLHANMAHALEKWRELVRSSHQRQHDLIVLGRFVAKLQHHCLLRVVLTWVDLVGTRKETRALMMRIILRLCLGKVVTAFETLRKHVDAARKTARKQKNLQKWLSKLVVHETRRALCIWQSKLRSEDRLKRSQTFLRVSLSIFFRGRLRGQLNSSFALWARLVQIFEQQKSESQSLAVKQMRDTRRVWEEEKQKRALALARDHSLKVGRAWRLWTKETNAMAFEVQRKQMAYEMADNIAEQIEMAQAIERLTTATDVANDRWVRSTFAGWAARMSMRIAADSSSGEQGNGTLQLFHLGAR